MWKYRDLTELAHETSFVKLIKDANARYVVTKESLYVLLGKYLFHIYGFTIEDCLYFDVYDMDNKKGSSLENIIRYILAQECIKSKCDDVMKRYETTNKNYYEKYFVLMTELIDDILAIFCNSDLSPCFDVISHEKACEYESALNLFK